MLCFEPEKVLFLHKTPDIKRQTYCSCISQLLLTSSLKGFSATTCAIKKTHKNNNNKNNRKKLQLVPISKILFCFIYLSLHDLSSHSWGSSAPIFGNVLIPASRVEKDFNHLSPKRDSLQAHTEARKDGYVHWWTSSSILPGWGDSLPVFSQSLLTWSWRGAGKHGCCALLPAQQQCR